MTSQVTRYVHRRFLPSIAIVTISCAPEAITTLEHLTPIAVQAHPASAQPGDVVRLELTYFDEASIRSTAASDEVRIVWIGGCHNPPGDSALGCLPLLDRFAEAAAALANGDDAAAPLPQLSVGTRYEMRVPEEPVAARARSPELLPFGVSYAFFAACRGQLRALPPHPERVPLHCVGTDSKPVDDSHFAMGFTTVYVFDELRNENPQLTAIELDGERVEQRTCSSSSDCDGVGRQLSYTCRAERCLPVIQGCTDNCRTHSLAPRVSEASSELDPTSVPLGDPPLRETLWAKYYALGSLDRSEALVADREGHFRTTFAAQWTPPAERNLAVPLWIVVQDNRGGTAPARVDVWLE